MAVTLFTGFLVWRDTATSTTPDSTAPPPQGQGDPPATTTTLVEGRPTRVGYLLSRAGTMYSGTPLAANIPFAVLAEEGDGYRVMDVCNREGFLAASDVTVGEVLIDRNGFADAAFVIDAGHGNPDLGAVGPTRLLEGEANVDVANRVVQLLASPHDIDWATGQVSQGDSVPAAHTVVATRPADGPNGGDFEVGLTFRGTLANSIDADAFVSIHHNSGPSSSLDHPGSEAYVSAFDDESARLGALMVDELRRSFAGFDADWSGGSGEGVIARIGSDGGDYYTVIDVAEVPAVIVEGVYISNPSEEALAKTDAFRQAYAEAVYRALVRFVTTSDNPIPEVETQNFAPSGPGRSMDDCVVPPLE
ncbi:MAG TPA: N-acetylmuramoyl-L-alanine amidase [Acidimicrobiia bacterium]